MPGNILPNPVILASISGQSPHPSCRAADHPPRQHPCLNLAPRLRPSQHSQCLLFMQLVLNVAPLKRSSDPPPARHMIDDLDCTDTSQCADARQGTIMRAMGAVTYGPGSLHRTQPSHPPRQGPDVSCDHLIPSKQRYRTNAHHVRDSSVRHVTVSSVTVSTLASA